MLKSLEAHLLIGIIIVIAAYFVMQNRIICPAEMRPYTDKFMAEAKTRNVKWKPYYLLFISFSDKMSPITAGSSYDSWDDRNKIITINTGIWKKLSAEQRQVLISHELGHSILHRGHTEEMMMNLVPKSIMYPSIIGAHNYSLNEAHYWTELFSKRDDL